MTTAEVCRQDGLNMADAYRMDSHKLLWHLDRVNALQRGERIAPLYLDVGITQTCNVRCSYCYYSVPERSSGNIIETPALIAFLQDAAAIGVKAVGFLGDGEPMLHPGAYEAVIAGRQAGIDIALSTNGTVLPDSNIDKFLSALSWIRFTVGGATPSTYCSVMGVDEQVFLRVMENIRRCVEVKKRLKLNVTIGIQMILIPECLPDIIPFAALGRELGVDYAVIKQCSSQADNCASLTEEEYELHKEVLARAVAYSGDGYSLIVKWRKISSAGRKDYDHCYGCELLPQISGNGDLYCCGAFFGNPDFFVGNINRQSFRELVFGDRYAAVMKRVKETVDVHRDCGIGCRQNEINEFLWQLRNRPNHVNFI